MIQQRGFPPRKLFSTLTLMIWTRIPFLQNPESSRLRSEFKKHNFRYLSIYRLGGKSMSKKVDMNNQGKLSHPMPLDRFGILSGMKLALGPVLIFTSPSALLIDKWQILFHVCLMRLPNEYRWFQYFIFLGLRRMTMYCVKRS